MLGPQVHSRLGLGRLVFAPYNREQIQTIVSSRLEGLRAFESAAIEMAARKVASISGDIRRALQICRRAAEIARARYQQTSKEEAAAAEGGSGSGGVDAAVSPRKSNKRKRGGGSKAAAKTAAAAKALVQQKWLVSIQDVNRAATELCSTHHMRAVELGSIWEQVWMAALSLELYVGGTDVARWQHVIDRFRGLLRIHYREDATADEVCAVNTGQRTCCTLHGCS